MAFDLRKAFKRLVGWRESPSEVRQVAELALWAATSDERIEDDEVEHIAATLQAVPGLEGFDESELHDIIEAMEAYETDDAVFERVSALTDGIRDPALRRVCFQLCAFCAMNDGELTEDEEDFLGFVRERFALEEDEARRLLDEVTDAR